MITLYVAMILRLLAPEPLSWDERRRIGVEMVCDPDCAVVWGACWRCPACCATEDADAVVP